jgi:hypothetical protein
MIVMMAAARLVHPLLGALFFGLIVVTTNKETILFINFSRFAPRSYLDVVTGLAV